MCKHRSLSTPSLPGACAARHYQAPVIQEQLPPEYAWHASGCCNVTPASAAAGSPRIRTPPSPRLNQPEPPISCSFNPVLSERRTDALRRPTCRGGSKSKAEPRELSKQKREREISPSSLRSSGLKLHNQTDVPCICGIPERTTNHPKLRRWPLGAMIHIFFSLFLFFCVEDRLLVLQTGIRAVPLRWESQVQDTGPQETSQLHVISNGKNLPEIAI